MPRSKVPNGRYATVGYSDCILQLRRPMT